MGHVRQSYRERVPVPGLARQVSCLWIQHVAADGGPYEHRTVPNGSAEIWCDLDTGTVHATGPRRAATVDLMSPGTTVVGIRFRAGVAPAILGAPASALVDQRVELDRLWGPSAIMLGDKLAGATSPAVAARLLESEVAARSATVPDPDSLVAETVRRLQPWSAASVSEAASALFVSTRQLHRRCLAVLGYGPKALQRILRFQGFLALSQARHHEAVPLARLAAAAGYADQAHLTRECTRLTGLTPKAFLEETGKSCGATHDHTASFAKVRRALGARVRAA